jgi:hypothetical protein
MPAFTNSRGRVMKTLILAVAICAFCGATRAQSLAQPSVSRDCGTAASCSVSLANPVTLGNSLLAIVRLHTTQYLVTKISDSLGNAYTLDGAVVQTIDGHSLLVYRSPVTTSGTATLSVYNSSAATARIIGFAEVTGLITGPPDGINKAIGSNNKPQAGPVLPTQSNDFILLASSTAGNETFTDSAGFHSEQSQPKGAFGDQYQATAASINGSMTLTAADQWTAMEIAYKTMARLPLSFQLNYNDGTPVQGSVQLSSVSGTTTTPVASWPISSTGSVAAYLPLVNTGTYSYTALDPAGRQLQAITVLPGALATLGGLHSIRGILTLNKANFALMIPASVSMQ